IGARQHQEVEAEGAGPAGVVGPLIGDVDDGDVPLAERLGENRRGAGDAGGAVAEAGAEAFRLGEPFVEETRRASQEAVTTQAAVDCLFKGNVVHASVVFKNLTQRRKGAKKKSKGSFFAPLRLCVRCCYSILGSV